MLLIFILVARQMLISFYIYGKTNVGVATREQQEQQRPLLLRTPQCQVKLLH